MTEKPSVVLSGVPVSGGRHGAGGWGSVGDGRGGRRGAGGGAAAGAGSVWGAGRAVGCGRHPYGGGSLGFHGWREAGRREGRGDGAGRRSRRQHGAGPAQLRGQLLAAGHPGRPGRSRQRVGGEDRRAGARRRRRHADLGRAPAGHRRPRRVRHDRRQGRRARHRRRQRLPHIDLRRGPPGGLRRGRPANVHRRPRGLARRHRRSDVCGAGHGRRALHLVRRVAGGARPRLRDHAPERDVRGPALRPLRPGPTPDAVLRGRPGVDRHRQLPAPAGRRDRARRARRSGVVRPHLQQPRRRPQRTSRVRLDTHLGHPGR